MLQKIENWFFKFRLPVLAAFVLITIVMAYFAVQIRMDAGFAKQLPNSHSFVKTYYEYQDDLSGTNSITVALRKTEGDIFTKEYLTKLFNIFFYALHSYFYIHLKSFYLCFRKRGNRVP